MWDVVAELLGLMDEPRHAQRLMADLAGRVLPEQRALVEAGTCGIESRDDDMERWTRTICRIDAPCGQPVEVAVFYEPITGAVTDVWDLAGAVLAACPEMLDNRTARTLAEDSLREALP